MGDQNTLGKFLKIVAVAILYPKFEKVIKITQNVEGFLKIDTLCFELSHSIESSLRSLSTM